MNAETVAHIRQLLDSHRRFTGRELIPRSGDPVEEAERLDRADFVVASHGREVDPVLNYGNRRALALWEMAWERFTATPSRYTAEAPRREERQRLLDAVRSQGYIDDYSGIRISAGGRRFRIEQATVWTVVDEAGDPIGQAATFDRWDYL
ncbi:MEKHLA domain-containing protein [Endothiovibrio diazotrophicus]